ncbi:hypothetical protein KVR01_007947 [Diaporthe batatas]|uniref:uncharacterized protein n=1 Tax=Diaporthe batatas TaxID=748121 RepID=UPI001D03D684|nr:uncharacterized protein KVR01_007947 [Diaporthe batatas]KAG8162182.1 hypothetical protein KVR01_007947 [Diaporthe batatas]
MHFLSLLALAAPLASAIQFTNPTVNSTLTRGSTFDLQWSTVDTDPEAFSVYLVNFVNWPPYYAPVSFGVDSTTGETSVKVPCDVNPSYGYQFNAINGTNVYVIYAQTPKFSIAGAACTDEPAVTAGPTCAAATATVTATVTVRGNSTLLVSPTPTPTGSTTPPLGNELVAKSKYEGECPEVIGWVGGYDSPVKLTEVPRSGSSVGISAEAQVGGVEGGLGLELAAATNGKVKSKCSSKKRRARRHA